MFSVGESVVYGTHGVCVISEITKMPFGDEMTDYYILEPVSDKRSKIYVPVGSEGLVSQMRPVLTENEIHELLSRLDCDSYEWIASDSERKIFCTEIMKSGDRLRMMNMIRMLCIRQNELKEQKKHFHVTDEKYLNDAIKLINDEFSYVLGISVSEVPAFIEDHVPKIS